MESRWDSWCSVALKRNRMISAANPNGIEIIQPRVARHELPWESNRQRTSTLKGLNHRANDAANRTDAVIPQPGLPDGRDATPMGLMNCLA